MTSHFDRAPRSMLGVSGIVPRRTPRYPSKPPAVDSTSRRDRLQYTGDRILGIATMHKSNAVPVTSQEYGLDLANMRRNR